MADSLYICHRIPTLTKTDKDMKQKLTLEETIQVLNMTMPAQFIRKYHLTSASAVQRSLSALQEKDIVTSNNGQYSIYDYFLYYWLKQQ